MQDKADRELILNGDVTSEQATETEQDECVKPEGGWGWVVCCGTFTVNFIVFGIHNSFGVVYEYLVDEHNLGEAETGKNYQTMHKGIALRNRGRSVMAMLT